MSLQKPSIFKLAGYFVSVVSVLTIAVGMLGVTANAQVGIKPFSEDGGKRGKFLLNVEPGDTLQDHFVVVNGSDKKSQKAIIQANDTKTNTGGNLTYKSNSEENTGAGQWISIQKEEYEIPAGKSLKVPFTVNIPEDVEPGEYSAGITATPKVEKKEGGGVSIQIRTGSTIYFLVGDKDFKIDNQVKDLAIFNPRQEGFKEAVERRSYLGPENMVVSFNAENMGEVYARIKGIAKVTTPSGESEEFSFQRTLNKNSSSNEVIIRTGMPYEPGETKVELTYKSSPHNDWKEASYNYAQEGEKSLTYTLEMSKEEIDNFGKAREKQDKELEKIFGKDDSSSSQGSQAENSSESSKSQEEGADVEKVQSSQEKSEEEEEMEKENEKTNQILLYGGIVAGIIILLLVALIVVLVMKKGKKEGSQESDKK